MLVGDNITLKKVHHIEGVHMVQIKCFLQGAVYCWCKNRNGEWFCARDLVGGANRDWSSCPLIALYEFHVQCKSERKAFKQAGIDVGHILKQVLAEDSRIFETEYRLGVGARYYRWRIE